MDTDNFDGNNYQNSGNSQYQPQDYYNKPTICPRCGQPNDYFAHACKYCGFVFGPAPNGQYVNPNDPYNQYNGQSIYYYKKPSFVWQYIVSVLVPIVGIILGIVMLAKSYATEDEKHAGKLCIIIAIATVVITYLIGILIGLLL